MVLRGPHRPGQPWRTRAGRARAPLIAASPASGHRSDSDLSEWLRCPNCFLDLSPVGERTLGCANGHRFDVHRHGYVTLLPPRTPPHQGDSREMLVARDAVLSSGLYAPISDAVADVAAPALQGPSGRLIDVGAGTGHYSGVVAAHAHQAPQLLMADRSPAAVRWSTLANPGSHGVVLDTWAPLPIRDEVADVVLDVFAPRNPREFARILRPGGRLIVVVPRPEHLQELRAGGALLEVPEGKAENVTGQFDGVLPLVEKHAIDVSVRPGSGQATALRGMGPSAHHARAADLAPAPSTVTLAVDVLAFECA